MWLLLNESQTESQAMGEAVEEPIDAPAATGQPPPLPAADAVVMEEPVATGQPLLCLLVVLEVGNQYLTTPDNHVYVAEERN